MKIGQTITGKFSKLFFGGVIVKIDGGLISVLIVNPHRNLPIGPCIIRGKWARALTFHVNDSNIELD